MTATVFDYILVGGGLQSGLLTLALRHHQPAARVLLVERDSQLAGNHTWSFHPDDVVVSAAAWVAPAVEHRWPSYHIRLNRFEKQIHLSYASISSSYFAKVLAQEFDKECNPAFDSHETRRVLLLGNEVTEIHPQGIRTASGKSYSGRLVIDCRGPKTAQELPFSQCGYQNFWGFELVLQSDWPFTGPTIMDDRIEQSDGFRFIYSLPFDRRHVLVEDTRFANSPEIDRDECFQQIQRYLERISIRGWAILREEHGILPMPISSERMPGDAHESTEQVMAGGYAGGWFHAATGYSFSLATAFAEAIATTTPELAFEAVARLADSHRSRSRFARFLNRLLFCLVKPTTRYQIFRRFYRVLPEASIARFYAHQFTASDAFRIVVGLPPMGLQPGCFVRSYFSRGLKASNPNNPRVPKTSYMEIGV